MKQPVKSTATDASPRGRPRSQTARLAILRAAHELLNEGGLGAITMEAVASRAGVGKPTIYRSWPNRHALAMAAMMAAEKPSRNTNSRLSPLRRLHMQLHEIADYFGSNTGRQIASLLAAAEGDSELAKAFRTHFILARRDEGRLFLEAAQVKAQLHEGLNLDVLLDALYGAIFFRLLVGHAAIDRIFINCLVDNLLIEPH